ncbi:conserved hypothetical protein [Ferrimonas balearica DSM 9799]|uniref:Peptidase S8/S53 domain-containing protein n=1 Tax=Ferrimonas balearica (strain DSM 9799 / CCM 4581 / KCTC 23876 / PAT) TaxID=550540 RepID=E1SP27_FERBD|nr:S8 family peptidase [Ferrimonas balearica]ADN74676.1 conserved hypothetical protein [Ferrimonas balearica DSM 9799]
MSRLPLILLPRPESADPSGRPRGGGSIRTPSVTQQYQRLGPQFTRLEQALSARRLEIANTAPGIEPEYTVVIETYGHVSEFFRAIQRIPGLEWLGENELEGLEPNDDFQDERNAEKPMSGRTMLVLSDRRAIDELLSLWKGYGNDPTMQFARGWAKFRDVFDTLKDIRYWSVEDRLHDTGVIEYWQEELEYAPDQPVRFEAELWFRADVYKRADSQARIESQVNQLGGQVVSNCCIEGIAYHSLLVELPAIHVERILDDADVTLVKSDEVMLFRPIGQMCTIGGDEVEPEELNIEAPASDAMRDTPRVALLDGLPLANHVYLEGKLRIDDPESFEDSYQANQRLHGTAMASLIVNGDLREAGAPLSSPLYVRPILKPDQRTLGGVETLPADYLPVDLIHRAVKRMFEGEGEEEPVAPTVKVINLSIGDPNLHFNGTMSPLARLVDWLSEEYNVLFCVSAGNHSQALRLDMESRAFRDLSEEQQHIEAFRAAQLDTRNRKLLSPAESINALTIGATHADASEVNLLAGKLELYTNEMPALYSAHGNGYRRSIKPDLMLPGGRVIHDEPIGLGDATLRGLWGSRSAPGLMVPFPHDGGSLCKTVYSRGTSNANAIATRSCAQVCDALELLFEEHNRQGSFEQFAPVLIKALVAHGAGWGDIYGHISEAFPEANRTKLKSLVSQHIGYGKPDVSKSIYCLDNRATVLGFGGLVGGEAHEYQLPIPIELGGVELWRKLTVTLAWFAKPSPRNIKYRGSALWATLEGENREFATERTYDWLQVRRGTLHHEVFEGEDISVLAGQSELTVKVNCKDDATSTAEPVKYGLAITLEVAEGEDVEIYEEIKERINVKIREQAPLLAR